MTPWNLVSIERDSRFCSNLMQNDDLPDQLGPTMLHVKGFLNLRSSQMTDLEVYPTTLLNITEGNGRVFTEPPSLKEWDCINLFLGLGDYIILQSAILLLILCSVWTVTLSVSSRLNTRALMTSKLTVWRSCNSALFPALYTLFPDCLSRDPLFYRHNS